MKKIIHDNYVLDVNVIPSGIDGIHTLEIHQTFPEAQNPRSQRILQLNLTKCQLWEIGSLLHTHIA